MKSHNLICLVLLVSMALASLSEASRLAMVREHVGTVGKFLATLTGHAMEWAMALVSLGLVIKASPRILQNVFMQMHKDLDALALPIYATAATIAVAVPLLAVWRKGEGFQKWLPKQHHYLAALQGLVAATTVYLCEEKYEVNKQQQLVDIQYYRWRWALHILTFVATTCLARYLFGRFEVDFPHYFIGVSLLNMAALAFCLFKFDKNWKPSLDPRYESDYHEIRSYAEDLSEKVSETISKYGPPKAAENPVPKVAKISGADAAEELRKQQDAEADRLKSVREAQNVANNTKGVAQ